MASDQIFKDVCEIHARLFDHHPALQTELNLFVQEFQTKRNNRELSQLQKTLENCREMNENLLTESATQAEKQLPPLVEAAKKAAAACDSLVNREAGLDTENSWLKQKREERVSEWSKFMNEMCAKSQEIDQRHAQEIQRLDNYYKDLEAKLKIHA